MTPKFISFEGTEGVGKTTAIDNFCTLLTTQNIPFVRTREPGEAMSPKNCETFF